MIYESPIPFINNYYFHCIYILNYLLFFSLQIHKITFQKSHYPRISRTSNHTTSTTSQNTSHNFLHPPTPIVPHTIPSISVRAISPDFRDRFLRPPFAIPNSPKEARKALFREIRAKPLSQ